LFAHQKQHLNYLYRIHFMLKFWNVIFYFVQWFWYTYIMYSQEPIICIRAPIATTWNTMQRDVTQDIDTFIQSSHNSFPWIVTTLSVNVQITYNNICVQSLLQRNIRFAFCIFLYYEWRPSCKVLELWYWLEKGRRKQNIRNEFIYTSYKNSDCILRWICFLHSCIWLVLEIV